MISSLATKMSTDRYMMQTKEFIENNKSNLTQGFGTWKLLLYTVFENKEINL